RPDAAGANELYEHRAIAEKEVVAARNDLAQATEGLEAARALREQAKRKLELLGLTTRSVRQPVLVRAPITGKVIEVNVAPGAYRRAVSSHTDTPAAPLMTIADLHTVWVSADVPEPALHLVRVGEPVKISFISLPGETFSATVSRIGDVLDPQTRTFRVQVELRSEEHTSELQSLTNLVCRLLLEKKKT